MCLEPNFFGVASGGSRCKHFAMLKRGFKEALDATVRQASMEMSHWAATNLHWNFCDSLVCSAVGSGSRLCSQSFSYSAISTLLQRCSKGDVALQNVRRWFCSFIELLHLCHPGWAEVQSELTRHLPQLRCLYKMFGHSLLLPIL